MRKIAKLKVDVKTNWGIVPRGGFVVVLDDETPLHQSFRVMPFGADESQIFGVDKTGSAGILDLE